MSAARPSGSTVAPMSTPSIAPKSSGTMGSMRPSSVSMAAETGPRMSSVRPSASSSSSISPSVPYPTACADRDPKQIAASLFHVPDGFQALLKHISHQLFSAKPPDPYQYILEFLTAKLSEREKGMLDVDFLVQDSLNVENKRPRIYIQQTSLIDLACPSNTAFDAVANEAVTTVNAATRGVRDRVEVMEIRRDDARRQQRMSQQPPKGFGRRSSGGQRTTQFVS